MITKKIIRKKHNLQFIFSLVLFFITSESFAYPFEPQQLQILKRAYPNILFNSSYDFQVQDFKIEITPKNKNAQYSTTLYWAGGKLLPLEEINNQDSYKAIFYKYAKEIENPETFSTSKINSIRSFSSVENRAQQISSSLHFFDAIYDASNRSKTEAHIKQVSFLGKKTNAHEMIFEALARVEKKIIELSKTDPEVKDFINNLSRVDSYNWREIGDRAARSFHSYGIAVDILPKGWGQKNIYWAWRRDIDPDNWMILPLDRRWMPPQKVISAFESEGFIWGGKWTIWDNMHFEYRPELIQYNNIN